MGLPLIAVGIIVGKIIYEYSKSNERSEGRKRVREVMKEYNVPEDYLDAIINRLESGDRRGIVDDIKEILEPYMREMSDLGSAIADDFRDVADDLKDLTEDAKGKLSDCFLTIGKALRAKADVPKSEPETSESDSNDDTEDSGDTSRAGSGMSRSDETAGVVDALSEVFSSLCDLTESVERKENDDSDGPCSAKSSSSAEGGEADEKMHEDMGAFTETIMTLLNDLVQGVKDTAKNESPFVTGDEDLDEKLKRMSPSFVIGDKELDEKLRKIMENPSDLFDALVSAAKAGAKAGKERFGNEPSKDNVGASLRDPMGDTRILFELIEKIFNGPNDKDEKK
ncbi:hypothetical protein ACFL08_03070 [Patescibacteria group bacterium]